MMQPASAQEPVPDSLPDSLDALPNQIEPRVPGRFPIERDLLFRMTGRKTEVIGSGRTLEMSSKSVVFHADKTLLPGKRVELAISWPVQLDNHCALKLVARGRIVSTDFGEVAVSIEQYEFRTLGPNGLSL